MSSIAHRLLLAGAACAGASCQVVGGIENTSAGGFQVRASAAGVLAPVQLELTAAGLDTRTITVDADGAIAFPAVLADGDTYLVRLVGQPRCALEDAAGAIRGANADVGLFCEGVTRLAALDVVSPAGADLAFDPAQTTYSVGVRLLQSAIRIAPTAAFDDVTITAGGAAVASGAVSDPVPVSVGDNRVEVVVRHRSGLEGTYQLDVARSGDMAQDTYAKSSAPGSGLYDLSDSFGFAIAAEGDVVAIGAPFVGESDRGAVFVFRRSGAEWAQEAMLQGPGAAGEQFGIGVALSGDTIAVGADGAAGAVFVFDHDGARWNQSQVVTASNAEAGDAFGRAVALDGDTLAVGAFGEDSNARGVDGNRADNSASTSGAAYVFERTGGAFVERAYLKPLNTDAGDRFGLTLALSGDVLAIGAEFEDSAGPDDADNSAQDAGAVYVFRRDGDSWRQEAYLKASNAEADDRFGRSIAVDGGLIAVGSQLEDSSDTRVNGDQDDNGATAAGAAYVFVDDGGAWRQEAYLKAFNADASDFFGTSLSLRGGTLAVGAVLEDSRATGVGGDELDNSRSSSGAVYLFNRRDGAWSQVAYVKASNTDISDQFGTSVALTPGELFVGARGESSGSPGINGDQNNNNQPGSGAAYFFR